MSNQSTRTFYECDDCGHPNDSPDICVECGSQELMPIFLPEEGDDTFELNVDIVPSGPVHTLRQLEDRRCGYVALPDEYGRVSPHSYVYFVEVTAEELEHSHDAYAAGMMSWFPLSSDVINQRREAGTIDIFCTRTSVPLLGCPKRLF